MKFCAITKDMQSHKKRLTIQLDPEEEWVLTKAHIAAMACGLSMREWVLEAVKTRIDKDSTRMEALVRTPDQEVRGQKR